jgi:hypothetical protein
MNNNELNKIYELACRISCRCMKCRRGGDYSMANCLRMAKEFAEKDFLDRALDAMRNN